MKQTKAETSTISMSLLGCSTQYPEIEPSEGWQSENTITTFDTSMFGHTVFIPRGRKLPQHRVTGIKEIELERIEHSCST